MTRRSLSALLALVVASATLSAQLVGGQQARDSQAQSTDPSTGLIMGTVVVAGTGQPADGVRLTLSGAGIRGSRSALTDDDGKFVFVGLPASKYMLRATKAGYVSATYGQKAPGRPGTTIVLSEAQQLKDLEVELPKGGVIAGVIYDEKNRPAVSTPVRVSRWTLQSGERVLQSAGTATTDDRGMYRVFGLAPGDYVVFATPRNNSGTIVTTEDLQNLELAMRAQEQALEIQLAGVPGQEGTWALNVQDLAAPNASKDPVSGYAPVYFPGTPDLGIAREVSVGVSEEQLGIDFQLQRVTLSRVTGHVTIPPGVNTSTVQVRLVEALTVPGAPRFSSRAQKDGSFTFNNVPPGQYQLLATATVARPRPQVSPGTSPAEMEMAMVLAVRTAGPAGKLWAMSDVTVDGGFQPDVNLTLQEGMKVSGTLVFQGNGTFPTALNRVRVTLSPYGQEMSASGVGSTNVNADERGEFTLTGVVPGRYRLRASGASGWSLKTAMANGMDVLDFWLDVEAGKDVSNVVLGFGDAVTDLKGTLQSQLGEPTSDYTVIIFPSDPRYWVPLARRMRSVRPATDGQFSFTGLPPGDYQLATVTDVETGAWFDPEFLQQLRPASVSVRLIEGQPVVKDLRVSR